MVGGAEEYKCIPHVQKYPPYCILLKFKLANRQSTGHKVKQVVFELLVVVVGG